MHDRHRRKHLNKLATLYGETPEEIKYVVDGDWKRIEHMQTGHLPAAWRDRYLL